MSSRSAYAAGVGTVAFITLVFTIALWVGAVWVTVRAVKKRKHCVGAQVCGGIGMFILYWYFASSILALIGGGGEGFVAALFLGAISAIIGGVLLTVSNKIYDSFVCKMAVLVKNDPMVEERCSGSALEAFYVYNQYPCSATVEIIKKHNPFAAHVICQMNYAKLPTKKVVEMLRAEDAKKASGAPVPPRTY